MTGRATVARGLLAVLALWASGCSSCNKTTSHPDGGGAGDGGTVKDGGGGVDGGQGGDGGRGDGGDAGVPIEIKLKVVAPPRGPSTGGTAIILQGGGFVFGFAQVGDVGVKEKTQIWFGANQALDFTVVDDDTIQVVSPAGLPGAADVKVVNPNGTGTCAGCFTYFDPVKASAISPATGDVHGGTAVTITGSGFTPDTFATVGGRELLLVAVPDTGHVTGLTPPGVAGDPVDVRVMNKNGVALLRKSFTYAAAPKIAHVDPPGGPIAGGSAVTLVGEGLSGATAVFFGGAGASGLAAADDGHLAVVTPPHAAGAVDVAVTTPAGTFTLVKGFAYYDPADLSVTLLAVSPGKGPLAGGNSVTLVGTGFAQAPNPQARFGTTDGTALVVKDDHFATVTVPAGAALGAVDVQFRNDAGGSLLAGGYRYVAQPTVAAVTPASGPSAGGTAVTITGQGFATGQTVYIGALAATGVTVNSPTELVATTAPGAEGGADVRVVDPSGEEGVLKDGFTYLAPARIDAVVPDSGSQAGGTRVTIYGAGFLPGMTVAFQGSNGTDLAIVDHHTAILKTPKGNAGAADVTVTSGTPPTQDTLKAGYTYLDPGNILGGETGGPMNGTLNISVFDGYICSYGAPIPGAHVVVGPGGSAQFTGMTDVRGQVTISDASLIKPVTVAEWQGDGSPQVIESVGSQNLSLYGGQGLIFTWAVGTGGTVLLSFGNGSLFPLPGLGITEDLNGVYAAGATSAYVVGAGGAIYEVGQDPLTPGKFVAKKDPSGTSAALYGVTATFSTAVAVGDGGTIVRKNGASFSPVSSGTGVTLRAVAMGDSSHAVAVGDGGTILVSINSGTSWAPVTSPVTTALRGVACAMGTTCLAVGDAGVVLRSDDLAVWTPLTTNVTDDLTAVAFTESAVAFAVGANGRLIRTFDGGTTWKPGPTGAQGTLAGVAFANPLQGMMVGPGGTVLYTDDGGDLSQGLGAGTGADLRGVSIYTGCVFGGGGGAKPAEIKGKVYGFKLPQGVTLAADDKEVAIAALGLPSVYYLPPMGGSPQVMEIPKDGAGFDFVLSRGGRYGVWAYYGVLHADGRFDPLILGAHRDIEVKGGELSDGNDVLLDVALDTDVPMTVPGPPAPAGSGVIYSVYSYLDLGADGIVPVYDHWRRQQVSPQSPADWTPVPASSTTESFTFAHHPSLAGDAFIFLNLASKNGGYPQSWLYRRQPGNLANGITLGPMMPFETPVNFPDKSPWTSSTLSWTFAGSVVPDLVEVSIYGGTGRGYGDYLMPGSQQSLTIPDPIWQQMKADLAGGHSVNWSFTAAHAPKFDYDHWSYGDLSVVDWTSFVEDQLTGTIP